MTGAFLGLGVAIGLLLIFSRVRATAPLSISERIALRVGSHSSITPSATSLESFKGLFGAQGMHLLRFIPLAQSDKSLKKLKQAGRSTGETASDLAQFRLEQITWLSIGLIGGTAFGVWNIARGVSPIVLVVTIALGGVGAYLAHEKYVSALAKKRTARIDQQFPDIAELLAFSVTAGETPLAALNRVAGMSQGILSQELHICVREIRAGETLSSALRAMAERTGSRNVERFTDGLVIAMERGTPLSEVLRAQAADARNQQRQYLIELAGKKDVAMLIPVVFLILPTVIVIALFPAIRGLQVLVP
jgi:tight adherence protein C